MFLTEGKILQALMISGFLRQFILMISACYASLAIVVLLALIINSCIDVLEVLIKTSLDNLLVKVAQQATIVMKIQFYLLYVLKEAIVLQVHLHRLNARSEHTEHPWDYNL